MEQSPLLIGVALFALSTWFGVVQVKKLIAVYEARHELKRGSAGWIRSISGWSLVAFWLLATWFVSTVLGDWFVTEDLGGALLRAELRLRIILEIAIAIADSD